MFKKLSSLNLYVKILIALTILLSIWLAFSYYLAGQASNLVFNNRVSWAPVPQYNYELSFIKNESGQNISLWWMDTTASENVVLYLHGNAGRLPNLIQEFRKSAKVLSPAYPGYHESEGTPTVENSYQTAEAAYRWLVEEKKVPEDKIIIVGHSMGGGPATYLASIKPKAKRLVLINTFSSIQSMCFRQYSIFCVFAGEVFNSARNAEKVTIPVTVFAYRNDLTIPFEEGQKLFEYFPETNRTFVEMNQYTHSYPDFELINKALK